MERGFYHPDRGYWQTNSDPSPEILARYPEGTVEIPLKPGALYDWNGQEWVAIPPPPEPVPDEISKFQAKEALRKRKLLDAVELLVTNAGGITQRAWEDVNVFRRNSVLLNALAVQMNPPLTQDDLDDLFREAAKINV